MKMNVEIDMTPEEARRLMGLPDVTKANEAYVDNMTKLVSGAGSMEQMDELSRQMAPMGQMGLKMFQQLMEQGAKAAFTKSADPDPDTEEKAGKK